MTPPTRRTDVIRLPHIALAAVVAVTLAGCTPTAEPSVINTPEIEWQTEAPVENDRYAEAARAADLGAVLAWNFHDFTIEQLSSTVTPELAEAYYENFQPLQRLTFPGPRPSSVISVTENSAGDGASVLVCRVSQGWLMTNEEPRPVADLAAGTETTYVVVTSDSGNLVVESEQPSGLSCDATEAAIGYFTPAPTIPKKIASADVRAPIGYRK